MAANFIQLEVVVYKDCGLLVENSRGAMVFEFFFFFFPFIAKLALHNKPWSVIYILLPTWILPWTILEHQKILPF